MTGRRPDATRVWDLETHFRTAIYVPVFHELPRDAPPFAGHTNGELRSDAGVPKEGPIPADLARRLRHGYSAATSCMDAQIGVVLDALDRTGLADVVHRLSAHLPPLVAFRPARPKK